MRFKILPKKLRMNKPFEKYTLKNIPTDNFLMTPLELHEYIDFEVKRVYFITEPTGEAGQHCHKEEKELFIMVQGKVTAVIDQGNGKEEMQIEGPKEALYVPNYVWHGFKNFSEDAILLAVSSTNYMPDRSDYIEDYDEYLKVRDEKLQ
jgi:mannose-6-phosphate isomerase-like protein (cupin superfamily)